MAPCTRSAKRWLDRSRSNSHTATGQYIRATGCSSTVRCLNAIAHQLLCHPLLEPANFPNRLGGRVYHIYILALCCTFFSHFNVYIKPPYFAYISHSIYNTEVQGESRIAATGWWERRRDSDDSDDDGRTKRMQKAEADLIAKRPRQVWVWKLRSQIHQPNLLPFDPHGTYGTL